MVEIVRYKILLTLLLFLVIGEGSAQVTARVKGLEKNVEYMKLLEQQAALDKQEDSLGLELTKIRDLFKANPDKQKEYSDQIIKMESSIFGVRSSLGQVASKISVIEQNYVLKSLNSDQAGASAANSSQGIVIAKEGNDKVMITQNRYFTDNLIGADSRALLAAQQSEEVASNLLKKYNESYQVTGDLIARYNVTDDPYVADSLERLYDRASEQKMVVVDSLDAVWSGVFDNKSYVYSYVLDKLNQAKLLEQYAGKLNKMQQHITEVKGKFDSDQVSSYVIEKRMLLAYEIEVSKLLSLDKSLDSLQGVAKWFVDLPDGQPKVIFERREFIDYDSVKVALPTQYNAKNPIADIVVPPVGRIYRLLLGSYSVKQQPSIFKGAEPLFIEQLNGRYNYYAGGIKGIDEAIESVAYLKEKRLRNPRIVVWQDGERSELSADDTTPKEGVSYRVIIEADGDLSKDIEQILRDKSDGREVAHIDNEYIVGGYTTKVAAQSLVEALMAEDRSLVLSIEKMEQSEEQE